MMVPGVGQDVERNVSCLWNRGGMKVENRHIFEETADRCGNVSC